MPSPIYIRYKRRYWTLARLFRHLGVSYKRGYSYYCSVGRPKIFTNRMAKELVELAPITFLRKEIEVDGLLYPSLRAAASAYSISTHTLSRRISKYGLVLTSSQLALYYKPSTPIPKPKFGSPEWIALSAKSNTGKASL